MRSLWTSLLAALLCGTLAAARTEPHQEETAWAGAGRTLTEVSARKSTCLTAPLLNVDCKAVCPPGYTATSNACIQCDTGLAYSSLLGKCLTVCPAGYTDLGLLCSKPPAYSRPGYPWQWGDGLNLDGAWRRCQKDWGTGNCEKCLAVVYPKCKDGYYPLGCGTCSPVCPGMTDLGLTCQKSIKAPIPGDPQQICPVAGLEASPTLMPPCFDPQCSTAGTCFGGLPSFLPIAHMVNTIAAVQWAMGNPAIAGLEMDVQFDAAGAPLEFRHSKNALEPCDCTTLLGQGVCGVLLQSPDPGLVGCQARTPAVQMLQFLATLPTIKLLYFDAQIDGQPADYATTAGASFFALVKQYLFDGTYTGQVLFSVSKKASLPYLQAVKAAALQAGMAYYSRVLFTIDGEDASVVPDLLALNAPRVVISGGQFALLSEISLVCSQIADGMRSAAGLYRQGLVAGAFAWTIDDASCWAELKKAGATAILTNYPTSSWVQ